MSDLTSLSLKDTARGLKNKLFSATELTHAYIDAMERSRALNAYILETPEVALRMAASADARIASKTSRPLEGIPISVKDNYCTKGLRTTAGSRILAGFTPTYESFVTSRVWSEGGVCLGKTNMDEFGMGSSTENSCFGPTINPRGSVDRQPLAPGGSSGGAAAALAANICAAALASDTGGSIRQPASFCGVVGFKPSYGVCSRWGMIAYASSLDQAGVLTKTVDDAAILMDTIAGHDPRDSTSIASSMNFAGAMAGRDKRLRIGVPRELREISTSPILEEVWTKSLAACESAGHEIVDVSLPILKYALPAYYIIALCEASSNLARYDGIRYGLRVDDGLGVDELYERTRGAGFTAETRKRILLGTFALSAGYYDQYYVKALKVRRKIVEAFKAAFSIADFMIWPVTPTPAFRFGSHSSNPIDMYLEDVFTVPVNLAGLPALSMPVLDTDEGLPMGVHLVGPRLSDDRLLAAASKLEEALGH
jgi:aspartyl-tRNA(Asn)/glutamyl-tRNA(Gln) amidotransferase subunit A